MPRKRRKLTPAAATSKDLVWVNKDMLTEILLRLPTKSLIKFKLVCKEWLSLISSGYFRHQHTLRGPKLQQSLIIQMHTKKMRIMQLFYFNPTTNGEKVMIPYTSSVPHRYKIVQGCNGLLLLEYDRLKNKHSHDPIWSKWRPENRYRVYNPTTKKSRKITLTNSDNYPYAEAINLAFDPSKSPYYKIVCVRSTSKYSSSLYTYQIEVYDSESHTWKLSFGPLLDPRISGISKGVYWNNSIFWSITHDNSGHCCFDIAKNEMKTLSDPPYPYPDERGIRSLHFDLQESNSHLYHSECRYFVLGRDRRLSVALWELGGDSDDPQWLLKPYHEIHRRSHHVYPLRFIGGSDGDETFSLLTYEPKGKQGRMMAYKFIDKSYESLVDLACRPSILFDKPALTCFQFGEVLALV